MGPQSQTSLEAKPTRSVNLWLIAALVFIVGLGAGVYGPAALTFLGLGGEEARVASHEKKPLTMPMPSGKIRRIDPPISNQPAEAVVVDVKAQKAEKYKQKFAAKNSKKADKKAIAKIEKSAKAEEKEVPAAKPAEKAVVASAPVPDLIEEAPAASMAIPSERLIPSHSVVAAKAGKAIARPVSLPPAQALVSGNGMAHSSAPLPMLKNDPRGEPKTYPVSINNASFSKSNLANCAKRCALVGTDASGNPIRAVIDGATYASALMQHNGTINISGQPRIIKNQQVLVVENITFNLAPSVKSIAGKRSRAAALPVSAPASAKGGYTEVSFENDDLKPGTVIKSRNQIPTDAQDEIPTP